MANGATVVLYEGGPVFPDAGRFWKICQDHGVTIFYTAPTAIRAFMRAGREFVDKHDLTTLRLLGTVGEPINPEAWIWYHRVIGGKRCPIVDTWWQTETGGIMITPLPGGRHLVADRNRRHHDFAAAGRHRDQARILHAPSAGDRRHHRRRTRQ
jgi:acetyl-CoA synthetase